MSSDLSREYIPLSTLDNELEEEDHDDLDVHDGKVTDQEIQILRRVPGKIPWSALIIAVVELAERSSYYGCFFIFPNFIQRPLPPGSTTGAPLKGTQTTPGALGKGLQTASILVSVLTFLAYLFPVAGGLIADLKLNKFRTIALGTVIGFFAHVVLVFSAWPSVLLAGNGLPPFIFAILLLSLATGLIKSNIAPLMCDQIVGGELSIEILPTGERVIVDRSLTLQRAMNLFYGFINVGAIFSAGTSFAEKYVGFWLAFAIPGVIFLFMPALLYIICPSLIISKPQGSILLEAWHVVRLAFRSGDRSTSTWSGGYTIDWEKAKPRQIARSGSGRGWEGDGEVPSWCTWDDEFVEELKRAFHGCKIFMFFPIHQLCIGGLASIITSMTGSMTTNGVPNDFFGTLNSVTVIAAIPILSYYIYPALLAKRIAFGPVQRVVVGFLIAATGYAYAGFVQWLVYRTSPCGYFATECKIGTGVSPISAWVTAPIPILSALSEALANVTGLEIAYNQAPQRLKSVVTSIFLLTNSISSAMVMLMVPLFKDPYLVLPFVGVSSATVLSAVAILHLFKDDLDDPAARARRSQATSSSRRDLREEES